MKFPGYKTLVISKLCETLIMSSLYLTKTTHICPCNMGTKKSCKVNSEIILD